MINCFQPRTAGAGKVRPVESQEFRRRLLALSRMSLALALLNACLFSAPARQSPSAEQNSQHLIDQAKEAEQKRDFEAAAGFYQDYLKSHPDDPAILQRLGLVNCLANRYEAAVQPLGKALRLRDCLTPTARSPLHQCTRRVWRCQP